MELIIILLLAIIALMLIPTAVGLLFIFHTILRSKKAPADASNRLNHIRLVWFALTREDLFVDTFEWMKRDEFQNLK